MREEAVLAEATRAIVVPARAHAVGANLLNLDMLAEMTVLVVTASCLFRRSVFVRLACACIGHIQTTCNVGPRTLLFRWLVVPGSRRSGSLRRSHTIEKCTMLR